MSDKNTCPKCGAAAKGNFCASCGTALGSRFCNQCGAKAATGAKFCTQCGASMAGGASGKVRTPATSPPRSRPSGGARAAASAEEGGTNMGWWVAGAMMVVVILFMAWPIMNPSAGSESGPNAPFAGAGASGGAGGAGAVDLSSMSPRQAADQLFDRVMRAASANDSAQVEMFLPMALQSYEMARPLDPDGLYHLSLLQRTGRLDTDALATAEEALQQNPNHLLALYAAASAAQGMGDDVTARDYAGRLLDSWDGEMASGNLDYEAHAAQMDDIRAFAQELVDGA